MSKNPDPNYWGNPPQTPTKSVPVSPQNTSPQNPYQHSACANQYPQSTQPNLSQPSKKRRGGLVGIIIGLILVFMLGIAGCVACTGYFISAVDQNYDKLDSHYLNAPNRIEIPDSGSSPSYPDYSSDTSLNNEYFRDAFGLSGKSSLTAEELDSLQASLFPDQSVKPNKDGLYSDGVFFVGSDIPAGGYWFSGSNDELSYFFILKPISDSDAYNVIHINSYYGHNLTNLDEGEVLVLVNDGTMTPLDSMQETFSSPYKSGTYRVGIDIPAGTYQLQLGEANDYSACYVMKDLEFNDESYLVEAYYIKGDQPDEITLNEGTYVELYNMSMLQIIA